MPYQIFNEVGYNNAQIAFDDTDWSVAKVMTTGLFNVYRIDSIQVSNSDSIDHTIRVYIQESGHLYTVLVGTVPAGSGFGVVMPVDLISANLVNQFGAIVVGTYTDVHAVIGEAITSGAQVLMTAGQGFC